MAISLRRPAYGARGPRGRKGLPRPAPLPTGRSESAAARTTDSDQTTSASQTTSANQTTTASTVVRTPLVAQSGPSLSPVVEVGGCDPEFLTPEFGRSHIVQGTGSRTNGSEGPLPSG